MEGNSRCEANYIPVTLEEAAAVVQAGNCEGVQHRTIWIEQNESDHGQNSNSEVIDRIPSATEVHSSSVVQLLNTEDRNAANEVPVTVVNVPQYVIAQSIADMQVSSTQTSTVTVTAADILASVSSLQHVVDSSSGNIYSIAPSSESQAHTSDTSSHAHPPTSVGSEDVESHSHVVGNIVTHYHLGLGLGQLLASHDQPADILIGSPVTIPVSDFGSSNTTNTSVSNPANVTEHDGSFLYNQDHQLVDDGNGHMTTSVEQLHAAADGTSQIKMEVEHIDGNPSSIDLNLEQEKEFDCMVETVSCYKCKVCSCILLSKEGVEQHVRMFHSTTKQQEKSPEHDSSVQNTVMDNSVSESNRKNDTDLYICSPCKKGFPDIDSFTVHMAFTHQLSAGNIQLEPLVLSNESGVQLPSLHQHHGQFLFAPSGALQSLVVQQPCKEEAMQIGKSTPSKGPPKKKKKQKTDNENGDFKPTNILITKPKLQDDEPENNIIKINNSEIEVILLDGEASKASDLSDGNATLNKKRVRAKKGKASPRKRKNTKEKAFTGDDGGIIGTKCDLNGCNVRLHSLDNLEYHRKCHSEDGLGFACAECKEKYDHWKTLSAHLWRVHLIDMELYTCDQCDYKSYSYGKLMNIHRRIHSDERPYLCDVCGKGFKTSKQLRNHKVIHLDSAKTRNYRSGECEICHRYFSDKRMLRVHNDTVHNKMRPYLCNYCGYAASCRSTLKMHIRQHTGEKPFACDSCEYRTADHNSLRRHKMRHSGEKPYKCPFCEYACIQSSTYKTHLKNKHPGMDEGLMFSCDQCTFKTIKKENFVTHMADHNNGTERIVVSKAVTAAATAAATARNQDTHQKMQTVRLPLQVVLTTETEENQETSVHLISQEGHEVHVTDASVFQQQIDGVMTQEGHFVFPVLEEMTPEMSSQVVDVFNVETENNEEKFPILAGQLKMGHLSSNPETESTTEIHLQSEQGEEQEQEEQHLEVQEGEVAVGSEDHIPEGGGGDGVVEEEEEEALSHAQLTTVPPTEVILKQE